MSFSNMRPRAALVAVVVAMVAPLISASPAGADAVGDKAAQARQITAQLEQLQRQVEVYAEQYSAAVVKLDDLQARVDAAGQKVAAANDQIEQRRREVAKYAVGDYARGGDAGTLPTILNSDGSNIGQRQGYARAAIGSREELLNSLNTAKDDGQHQIDALNQAKADAQGAKDLVDRNKNDAEAATAKTKQLNDQVRGELADLVRQEQARRAAEEQAAAEARARQQAEAARAAAPPAAPSPAVISAPTAPTAGSATGPAPAASSGTGGAPAPSAPAPAPAPAPSGGGGGGGGLVGLVESVVGTPYVWGGAAPGGFDCSGLIYWAYQQMGRSVPRTATAQMQASQRIPLSALQPGDLVFYDGNDSYINHIAVYVGNGQVVHAPHAGSTVKYDSLYFWDAIVGAGRL